MNSSSSNTLFSESQYFRQVWIWILLIGLNGLVIYGFVSQVLFGYNFGDNPMSNLALLITAIIMLLFTLLFWIIRLDTEIKSDGIYYRLYPFQLSYKQILWHRLKKKFVRQYSPLTEFGSWGFRIGLFGSGQAFNVSGNQGLQLVFDNDMNFLIGTQKPEEIEKVLKQIEQLKKDT